MTDMENFRTIWSIMIHTGHHLGPVDRESGARCTEIATLKKEEAAVQFHRHRLLRLGWDMILIEIFTADLALMYELDFD